MSQPKLINKMRPRAWVSLDLELMRDKRLNSDQKLIYARLCNLAQSCENVFPTYTWIASEIGYDTEVADNATEEEKAKKYDAIRRFISRQLAELENLKLIVKVANPGKSNDYEIYDYTPENKETCTPDKNVQAPPDKNVQGTPDKNVLIDKKEEKEKERREEAHLQDKLLSAIGIDYDNPLAYKIITAIYNNIAKKDIESYIDFIVLQKSKENSFSKSKLKIQAYKDWFYNDFLAWRIESQSNRSTKTREFRTVNPENFDTELEFKSYCDALRADGWAINYTTEHSLTRAQARWSRAKNKQELAAG